MQFRAAARAPATRSIPDIRRVSTFVFHRDGSLELCEATGIPGRVLPAAEVARLTNWSANDGVPVEVEQVGEAVHSTANEEEAAILREAAARRTKGKGTGPWRAAARRRTAAQNDAAAAALRRWASELHS
jgi:hypothetical protein